MDADASARADGHLRHIAEAFQAPGPSRPLPDSSSAVPLSVYTTYHPPPGPQPSRHLWQPRCTHSSMARIYTDVYRCESCRQPSPLGWLYRCVVDRDPLIMGRKTKGVPVAFDELGLSFAQEMTLGTFGPDARSKKLSFLDEISPEHLSSYTPHQLATVLSQREDVHQAIAHERNHPIPHYARQKFPDDARPWMPSQRLECQYKVCHRCHRHGQDKSWVSLDGVLKGEVLPTVAVGFSFSYMCARPVADANLVKNLGCRPVPLSRGHPARIELSASAAVDDERATETSPATELIPIRQLKPAGNGVSDALQPLSSGSALPLDGEAVLPIMLCRSGEADATNPHVDFEGPEYELACQTILADVHRDEQQPLADPGGSAPGNAEDGEEALDVVDGVALTEEGAESGTADIVAAHATPVVLPPDASA